ncbi:MAG: PEP-CTERM sorting domain-containing protein [Pirellulales bacterium]|nr:PEP-CTERM sorting domain-containing protein [Pirellulales bacterium]
MKSGFQTALGVALALVLVLGPGVATAEMFVPTGELDLGRPGDDPVVAGSYAYDGTTYTVSGSGSDWWDGGEYAHYVYQPVSGDFRIEADVTWINRTGTWGDMDNWVKAGLALRNDVDNGSGNEKEVNYFTAALRPDRNEVAHQGRSAATVNMFNTQLGGLAAQDNRLLALNRTTVDGLPYVEGFVHNGTDWVKIRGDFAMNLPDDAFVGLAVTAHNNDGRLESADFAGVQMLPATAAVDPGRSPGTPVNTPEVVQAVEGGWGVVEVINNGDMNSVADAIRSLEDGGGDRLAYNLMGPLNINDHEGSAKHFGNDSGYGVRYADMTGGGEVNHIALLARGKFVVPSTGDYSFYINSDDGEELTIDSRALILGSEGWSDNNIGTVHLTAGVHDIQVIHREATGGADVEVGAAPGATTNLDDFTLIGYKGLGQVPIPGLARDATMITSLPGGWAGGEVLSLRNALSAIAQGEVDGSNAYAMVSSVNHGDPDNGDGTTNTDRGSFGGDSAYPNDVVGVDDNDFGVMVSGVLEIPADGLYQLGFQSDDGASLQLFGGTWNSIVADATGNAAIVGAVLSNDSLTGDSFTAGEIFLTQGLHLFNAQMFERSGGAYFELFGRGVSESGAPDPSWHLLEVGGAGIWFDGDGLQLVVPEPSTWIMLLSVAAAGLVGLVRRRRKAS